MCRLSCVVGGVSVVVSVVVSGLIVARSICCYLSEWIYNVSVVSAVVPTVGVLMSSWGEVIPANVKISSCIVFIFNPCVF